MISIINSSGKSPSLDNSTYSLNENSLTGFTSPNPLFYSDSEKTKDKNELNKEHDNKAKIPFNEYKLLSGKVILSGLKGLFIPQKIRQRGEDCCEEDHIYDIYELDELNKNRVGESLFHCIERINLIQKYIYGFALLGLNGEICFLKYIIQLVRTRMMKILHG